MKNVPSSFDLKHSQHYFDIRFFPSSFCHLSIYLFSKDDLFLKDNGTEQFFTQNIWQILSFVTYINISYLNWTHFDNMKVIQIKKIIPKKISLHLKGFHSSSPIVFQK